MKFINCIPNQNMKEISVLFYYLELHIKYNFKSCYQFVDGKTFTLWTNHEPISNIKDAALKKIIYFLSYNIAVILLLRI